jgi:microcystin-dependent protein
MSTPYVGEIRMFGGNFAPQGWMLCQGQLLPISSYETLYNLIGTTYGGDGQNTFALPNLASRIPVHQGAGYVIGAVGGQETVTLQTSQLPVHNHVPRANTAANQTGPGNNIWAGSSLNQFSAGTANLQMANTAIGMTGNTLPHDNMLPFLAINFIISLYGVYPSPS